MRNRTTILGYTLIAIGWLAACRDVDSGLVMQTSPDASSPECSDGGDESSGLGGSAGFGGAADPSGGAGGSSGGKSGMGGAAGNSQGGASGAGTGGSSGDSGDAGQGGSDAGSGAAGEGGTNTGSGAAGQGGTNAGSGAAGQGGSDAGTAGSGGGVTEGEEEVTLIPDCITDAESAPPAVVTSPGAVAAARGRSNLNFNVIVADVNTNGIRQQWQAQLLSQMWTGWRCFDLVPEPSRVAAHNLSNGMPEVFAVSARGSLFVRRQFALGVGWGHWMSFRLPASDSHATDIALSNSASNRRQIYVLDCGDVFTRAKTSAEAYSPYEAWRYVGSPGGNVLAAGQILDGRQQVFSTTAAGEPVVATQAGIEPESAFSEWSDFDGLDVPPLVDLEVGKTGQDELTVFAVDDAGELWMRSLDGADWGPWEAWIGPEVPGPLATIAAGGRAISSDSLLVVVTQNGLVYSSMNLESSGFSWGAWHQM